MQMKKKGEFEEIACGNTIRIVSPGAFFRGKKIYALRKSYKKNLTSYVK